MRRQMAYGLIGLLVAVSVARAEDVKEVQQLKARVAQLEKEVTELRDRLQKLEVGSLPKSRPSKSLEITVLPGDWGEAPVEDIRRICLSAAGELSRYFPEREYDPMTVQCDLKRGPMVIFGQGGRGERRILINVKGTYWSQFAFQFGHEFCHILCNYRDGDKSNLWFEESLCEVASLFVLRRMAESWKTEPPYSNWKTYAPALRQYAADRLEATEKLDGLTLATWFKRNEEELRKTGTDRKKNLIVAAALLPLLEKTPEGWRAVSYLNKAEAGKVLTFEEYLRDWHQRVPNELKPFVAEVGKLFAFKLG